MNFPCSFSITYFFQGGRENVLKSAKIKLKNHPLKVKDYFP